MVKIMSEMSHLANEYKMYLTSEVLLSDNTTNSYYSDIVQYVKYLEDVRNIQDPKDISIDVTKLLHHHNQENYQL